ncbi:MAG: carbon-nitrogen hydrolase family protein [Spirochaetota bacterium]
MARLVKLATVQVIRPEWDKGEIEENIEQACKWLEEAGRDKTDIVCLPENVVGMCVPPARQKPQPIPGYAADKFAKLAKKYNMYIIAPMIELKDGKSRPMAAVIDRAGEIIGKYYKVHCTTPALEKGYIPGNDFTVFETDFGKIGIMICYDYFFPESARILTLKGAEILFFPTAGDGRGPLVFETLIRARAIDNCVPIVTAVSQNQGRSCIVNNQGYLIADTCEIPGVVTAVVDLDKNITRHEVSGGTGDLREVMLKARRPETYHEIVKSNKC